MVVPAGAVITAHIHSRLPWNAQAYDGFVGTTSAGEPLLVIGSEWPLSWATTVEPLSKIDRESLYIRRYSSDCLLATGHSAFVDVQRGGDPPDATALADIGWIGVESTSLTFESRRLAHNLFMHLRRRLESSDPARFARLAGHIVYVWFEDVDLPGGPLKPHRRSDTAALDMLVKGLAEHEPKRPRLMDMTDPLQYGPDFGMPSTLEALRGTPAGARFFAVPLADGAPSSTLFTVAAFDIGLAYTTILTGEMAWGEVQRLVRSHDQPGVNLLLITVCGPDANGNMFPAEEAMADFIVEHAVGLSSAPEHIEKVILHSWATGRATSLYPDIQCLFGPLYESIVPLHHSSAASVQKIDADRARPAPRRSEAS
jgi:hypothetical protein